MHIVERALLIAMTITATLLTIVLPASAADTASRTPAQPGMEPPKVFQTGADYVHMSSTPYAASAHGWWVRGQSDAIEAYLTVQLQINRGGFWQNVGVAKPERLKPGTGGSANRANARVECINRLEHLWRSIVDVDLIGYADSAEKVVTPAKPLMCGA
jgi:hypothetical protein